MKPMLAATVDHLDQLVDMYPLLASPKLDGIRAVVVNGVLYSRNMKPIPNKYVSANLPLLKMNGWDGELVVGKPEHPECFRTTTSGVMSVEGTPKFTFYVFDYADDKQLTYLDRLMLLKTRIKLIDHPSVKLVPQVKLTDSFETHEYEVKMLERGFEGVMLRKPHGIYKQGRSTLREGHLMKLKQFADSEAIVLNLIEQMENTNEKTTDELGRSKRSSHKAGKVAKGTLGSCMVRDIVSGVEFDVGSGFNDEQRQHYWDNPKLLKGKTIKYKYFPTGSKDKPRFPVFIGVRED